MSFWGKPKYPRADRIFDIQSIEAEKNFLRRERDKLFKEYDFIRLKYVGIAFTEEERQDFYALQQWFEQCKKIEEEFFFAKNAILNPPDLFYKYKDKKV
jgi:hypothetical protein